jgi:hypothetical protein
MTFFSSLYSIGPRVQEKDGRLVARTGWRFLLPTLGLIWREVVVDPKQEEVRVRRRYGWFFTRRLRIPFAAITSIAYDYADLSPGRGWFWTHDSYDQFTVRLRLRNGKELHLFHFFGDGTFTNDGPLPDWCYLGSYLLDVSGTQESESRLFVELLSKMIGVPIGTGLWS